MRSGDSETEKKRTEMIEVKIFKMFRTT